LLNILCQQQCKDFSKSAVTAIGFTTERQ